MEENIIVKATFSKRNAFSVIAIVLFALAGITATAVFGVLLLIYGTKNIEYLMWPCFGSALFLSFFGLITSIAARGIYKNSELVVTDNKIVGKDTLNRRVELPLEQISSLMLSHSKTIIFSTSSGRIEFSWVENCQEILDCVSALIENKKTHATTPNAEPLSTADELKKFKDLFDSGIITQEEFNAKKRQLLGI